MRIRIVAGQCDQEKARALDTEKRGSCFAMTRLRTQLATYRWRSKGHWASGD
jgi:hypothetical protein